MITIDLISISPERDKFTWFYFMQNKMNVHEYSGSPGGFEKTFYKLQINIIAELYADFIRLEGEIHHDSKELFLYSKCIDEVKKFIDYILKNEFKYEEIKKLAGEKMIKRLEYLYSLVPDSHDQKKYLFFIMRCVTLNSNHRIKVYD